MSEWVFESMHASIRLRLTTIKMIGVFVRLDNRKTPLRRAHANQSTVAGINYCHFTHVSRLNINSMSRSIQWRKKAMKMCLFFFLARIGDIHTLCHKVEHYRHQSTCHQPWSRHNDEPHTRKKKRTRTRHIAKYSI